MSGTLHREDQESDSDLPLLDHGWCRGIRQLSTKANIARRGVVHVDARVLKIGEDPLRGGPIPFRLAHLETLLRAADMRASAAAAAAATQP